MTSVIMADGGGEVRGGGGVGRRRLGLGIQGEGCEKLG